MTENAWDTRSADGRRRIYTLFQVHLWYAGVDPEGRCRCGHQNKYHVVRLRKGRAHGIRCTFNNPQEDRPCRCVDWREQDRAQVEAGRRNVADHLLES